MLCKRVEYAGVMGNGSKFLEKTADDWPNLPTIYESKPAELELAKGASVVVHAVVLVADKDRDTINLETLFDLRRYSTKLKLLRITGWVLSLMRNTRSQPRQEGLDANNMREAKLKCLKSIQNHVISTEYKKLWSSKYIMSTDPIPGQWYNQM